MANRPRVVLQQFGCELALLSGCALAGVFGGLFDVPVVEALWVLASVIFRRLRYGEADAPAIRPG